MTVLNVLAPIGMMVLAVATFVWQRSTQKKVEEALEETEKATNNSNLVKMSYESQRETMEFWKQIAIQAEEKATRCEGRCDQLSQQVQTLTVELLEERQSKAALMQVLRQHEISIVDHDRKISGVIDREERTDGPPGHEG